LSEVEVHEHFQDAQTCDTEASYEIDGVRYCVFHHDKLVTKTNNEFSIEEYEPEPEPEPTS
jgi:hypothetical protein